MTRTLESSVVKNLNAYSWTSQEFTDTRFQVNYEHFPHFIDKELEPKESAEEAGWELGLSDLESLAFSIGLRLTPVL